ncbi:HtaA domain-containing protein [Streptomyces sp. NBC_01754]|uniref:HtaA domain-containing protein n=1 Tax=Streptomyces sp. NBC_01754 TaxID=2975930 RepID=UPI002DD929EA|nr:HtaA domain-containing protein [Streptomyces sp. NBC_01754]WSC92191.1 HtaA domain-containing protein [Streptomyces sp. NBC_01754]
MLPSRSVRALAVALFAVLLGALFPATAAQAASRTVQGGRLDWAIKSSFQSYVTGPIAQGTWSLTGGAATVGGSQFRFHSATGSYDPASGEFRAGFSGGVRFVGHGQSDGTNQLDLTISRPTVRISGGAGTVYADMVSKDRESGRVTTSGQVPLATLNLSGIDMRGGGTPIALNNVPATLTAQGAKGFAGYYTAGTPLDPISLSADTKAPAEAPPTSTAPSPSPSKSKKPEAAGRFEDAAVDWGVRRTYREYVTGSIAQGKWTLTEGAQDGGALFRFPKGKGTYDAKKQSLDAAFTGRVRFTGEGGLDLQLSGVTVKVASGKGTLRADVTSEGTTRENVPLVTFTAKDLTPEKGLAVLTEAPATLTADGAKAFGSLYSAGAEMDPVSLAVAVDAKAELPALPDLGTTAEPSATPEEKPATTVSPQPVAAESGTGTGTYLAAGGGAVLLAAAGGGLWYTLRRRTAARNT